MIPSATNSFLEDPKNSKCHVTLVTEVGTEDRDFRVRNMHISQATRNK